MVATVIGATFFISMDCEVPTTWDTPTEATTSYTNDSTITTTWTSGIAPTTVYSNASAISTSWGDVSAGSSSWLTPTLEECVGIVQEDGSFLFTEVGHILTFEV